MMVKLNKTDDYCYHNYLYYYFYYHYYYYLPSIL